MTQPTAHTTGRVLLVSAANDQRCMVVFDEVQCVLPAFVSFYNGDEMIAPEAVCRPHVTGYLAELVGADLSGEPRG